MTENLRKIEQKDKKLQKLNTDQESLNKRIAELENVYKKQIAEAKGKQADLRQKNERLDKQNKIKKKELDDLEKENANLKLENT